jgi:hypothetical protein
MSFSPPAALLYPLGDAGAHSVIAGEATQSSAL